MNAQFWPGYKLTDAGLIPDDWSCTSLATLAMSVASGRSKPDAIYGEYPVYGSTGIIGNTNNPSHAGDVILVARVGANAGKLNLVTGKFGVTDNTIIIRLKDNLCLPFLYLQLERKNLNSLVFGSGQPLITGTQLKSLAIPMPELIEQHSIATALQDMEALINGLHQLITKKRDTKLAAMQQLLTGQQRLTGFSGDWVVKPIGESIDLLSGFPFPSDSYSDSGVKLLRGSNVKRGQTDWSDDITQFWPSSDPDIAKYEVKVGDLVISMDGSLVGKSYARIVEADLPALLLQRVARIRSRSIDLGFLTQFVGSQFFTSHCDSVKTVTAIPHISAEDIRSFSIPTPPTLEEQSAIATVLSDMDDELTTLKARYNKARKLKLAMMQELLTGRIRLK